MDEHLDAEKAGAEPETGLPPVQRPSPQSEIALVINAVADRVDPILKLFTAWMERSLQASEAAARHHRRMAWLASGVVLFVVVVAAIMTAMDKVDGSTFTFLLGLVVGYVLTFIKESISSGKRADE